MKGGIHLKGLNGIRAIAALSVVITHIVQGLDNFGFTRMHGLDLAGYGVTIFFALSGFLITYLLLIEKEQFKDIGIKQFYLRRILRIWPLYYFYLIISLITFYFYFKGAFTFDLIFYFLLSANIPTIMGHQIPLLFHFWSLGVEEQFYLFWPWVVKKKNALLNWLIWFIAILIFLKVGCWVLFKKTGNVVPLNIIHFTRFHCMAIGACGAILYSNQHKNFLKLSFALPTQLIVWGVIILCAINKFQVADLINNEIIAVLAVFLIVNVTGNPKTIIKLDNWYMDYLGKISFGIYVYHPLIIILTAKWLGSAIKTLNTNLQYAAIYFLVTTFTILIAGISYTYLEKPFLRLKDKFSRVHSSEVKWMI